MSKPTTPRMIRPGGFAVLCADLEVQRQIASVARDRDSVVVENAGQLAMVIKECRPGAVIIDREHLDADIALQQASGPKWSESANGERSPRWSESANAGERGPIVILLARDSAEQPPAGAQLVVSESSLGYALELVGETSERAPPRIEELLALSLLGGPLEEALASVADQIATAFGVARCVISARGDTGGGRTSDPGTWNHLERCQRAVASSATLLAMTEGNCESFVAAQLETPFGSHGLLGLVAGAPRMFTRQERSILQALASRLGAELGWRGAHDRVVDELARLESGPGLDPLAGIWNQVAMTHLMAALAAASVRSKQRLVAVVIDIVDLRGVNARYGLKVGDQMLRRIADAVRAKMRVEDLIGRWSGNETLVVLQDVTMDGARQIANELHAVLAERSIELSSGERVAIAVTIGIATLQADEHPSHMVARAAAAASSTPSEGLAVSAAAVLPPTALQIEVVEAPPVTIAGSYRLRHEISRGAMGVIYRADDLALERPVAIKMLRPDLALDHAYIERLRTEASLLARIQHPNLVQIYSFGQVGGDSYFVMELVEGEGLQEAIARHVEEGTKPALAANVAVIEEVASALDALHERGIIHRDVKPANVIRDPFRGRGVLVDVGIAHRAGEVTETAGTPGFIAPEILSGGQATARSDVYGLAATAYTILTLVEPFGEGESLHILARQTLEEPPPLPSSFVPELAPADAILLSGLHRDPAKRPASAGDFARALSAALSIVAASQRPIPRGEDREQVSPRSQTRGVVFRSVTRVLGVHDSARFRDAIGGTDPELAQALIDTAPLAWLPTTMFERLLAIAPEHELDVARFARDIARASVRASFRQFFPSSAATLMPERTLSAIRNVWGRYHNWGSISSMPVRTKQSVIRMTGTRRNVAACLWTSGMLEQLVMLSGGREPTVEHEACEALGNEACLFRVQWQ